MTDKPLKTGYPCTFFMPPNGTQRVKDIKNMRQADFDWFTLNKVKLSGELQGETLIFYADVGITLDDGDTPDEVIIFASANDDPYEQFHKLRVLAERKRGQHG